MNKAVIITVIILILAAGAVPTRMYILGNRDIDQSNQSIINEPGSHEGPESMINKSSADTGQQGGDSKQGSSQAVNDDKEKQDTPDEKLSQPAGSTGKTAQQSTGANEGKIAGIKNNVGLSDGMEASALAVKRLTSDDINELNSILDGEITKEEKARAKEIAYSRFTPEEIARIKELYHKYIK